MAKSILELLKDLFIFVLILAIVVLTLMALPTKTLTDFPVLSTVLRPVARYFGISQAELAVQQDSSVPAAAQPIAISVKNPGGRCTDQYDFAALDADYAAMGGTLAQALASCERPEETSRSALYAALSETSVAFCYPGVIPCGVLADWLGSETAAEECAARMYVLSIENDTVWLYLLSDTVQRSKTACTADSVRELCGSLPADGSFFAFESSETVYAALDGCTLLPAAAPKPSKVTVQNPCDSRFLTALASDLGFNPYGGSSYQDAAGTSYYTESSASLQITASGILTLENSDASRLGDIRTDASSRITAAASLLSSMLRDTATEARLYLTGYTATADGAVCSFCYVQNGIAILPQSGEISVGFTESYISSVHAVLRTYSSAPDTLAVLPPQQAAAISTEGSDLRLYYADNGQSSLSIGWRN